MNIQRVYRGVVGVKHICSGSKFCSSSSYYLITSHVLLDKALGKK